MHVYNRPSLRDEQKIDDDDNEDNNHTNNSNIKITDVQRANSIPTMPLLLYL